MTLSVIDWNRVRDLDLIFVGRVKILIHVLNTHFVCSQCIMERVYRYGTLWTKFGKFRVRLRSCNISVQVEDQYILSHNERGFYRVDRVVLV
jgi:hypothetical protein